MNDACRAANLNLLLHSPRLPPEIQELWPTFQRAFKSSSRGTCLSDSHALGVSGTMKTLLANEKTSGRLATVHKTFLPLAMKHVGTQLQQGSLLKSCLDRSSYEP